MVKGKGPGVVVDASVARAAGGPDRSNPNSTSNTRFLTTMTESSCILVMTREVSQEWEKHQSLFSRKWRNMMVAKKLFRPLNVKDLQPLDATIEACRFAKTPEQDGRRRNALMKDKHLLEAALASDNRIASCDDNAREPAKQLAKSCPPVRNILWIDPTNADEYPLSWLQQGAPLEPQRLLGHIEGQ